MDIFLEFKSLRETYHNYMIERFNDAPFYDSFECIYDVIDYIFECEQNGEPVTDDLFDLFTFGYRYLNEKFLYITKLLENVFKTDENLKKHYDDLDMLFYIMDFVTDAKLEDIEYEVFEAIEKGKKIKEDVAERVDVATKKTFRRGFHGFMESFEVLYDAITYGINDDEKDDGEFFEIDK